MIDLSFQFSQLDTWFFKESRPINSLGGSELASIFPPPIATLAGAVRTLIGDVLNINWQQYNKNPEQYPLQAAVNDKGLNINPFNMIGKGENTGHLTFSYPIIKIQEHSNPTQWLALTPMPQDLLLVKEGNKKIKLVQLTIAEQVVECDLGKVRLAELAEHLPVTQVAKPIKNAYLKPKGWQDYLSGKIPDLDQIIALDELIIKESRLGIGRDNTKGVTEAGLLYQTQHIRLNKSKFNDIAINVMVKNIHPDLANLLVEKHQNTSVRLGSEGRLAFVYIKPANIKQANMTPAQVNTNTKDNNKIASNSHVKLIFTSPSYFNSELGFLPPNFNKTTQAEQTVYCGKLAGQNVTIISQITDKALRIGGWDQATNTPKALRSFMPAGSCWYITCENPDGFIAQLNNNLGELTAFGYGSVKATTWKNQ